MAFLRSASGAAAPWVALLGCTMCAACAAVSGVDAFTTGSCAGECTDQATIDATSPRVDAGADADAGVDDSAEWLPDVLSPETSPGDAGEPDVRLADDAGAGDATVDGLVEVGPPPPEDATVVDGASTDATSEAGGDGGGATEAGDAGRCSPSSCNGCCTSTGACVPGTANPACGATGTSCQDCTTNGQVCSGGACVATSCVVASCKNTCVPYFIQCCKVDSTCGCALLFPPGPCN